MRVNKMYRSVTKWISTVVHIWKTQLEFRITTISLFGASKQIGHVF